MTLKTPVNEALLAQVRALSTLDLWERADEARDCKCGECFGCYAYVVWLQRIAVEMASGFKP